MAKNNFSSSVDASLNGRNISPATSNASVEKTIAAAVPEITPEKTKPKGKKSNAGRKSMDADKKKQQIMLTIKADSLSRLKEVDEADFKKLLGRYIDKNIDEIVIELEKL